jgi:hypothetical protein
VTCRSQRCLIQHELEASTPVLDRSGERLGRAEVRTAMAGVQRIVSLDRRVTFLPHETSQEYRRKPINPMKRKFSTLCLLLVFGCLAQAGDAKLDPTGTWKWVAPANPDGTVPKTTFTLKLQGEALSGTVTKSNGTKAITNGVFKAEAVSFQVLTEGHAGKSTTTYSGKLSGDTIKGKLEIHIPARNQTLSSDWEVKREAAKP